MRTVSLSELSALAADHVPGFVRPFHKCARCNGRGEFFHDVLHDDVTCAACDGTKGRFDNSPAALLMAVVSIRGHRMEKSDYAVYAFTDKPGDVSCAHDATPESIARAALVALLRAHGVEVAE